MMIITTVVNKDHTMMLHNFNIYNTICDINGFILHYRFCCDSRLYNFDDIVIDAEIYVVFH